MIKNKNTMRACVGGLVLIIALIGFLVASTIQDDQNLKVLDQLGTYTLNGRIMDVDQTIGVETYHDIYYDYDKKGNMTLYFGNVEIDLTAEQLKDPTVISKMDKIGLTMKGSKLYYLGDEIER